MGRFAILFPAWLAGFFINARPIVGDPLNIAPFISVPLASHLVEQHRNRRAVAFGTNGQRFVVHGQFVLLIILGHFASCE